MHSALSLTLELIATVGGSAVPGMCTRHGRRISTAVWWVEKDWAVSAEKEVHVRHTALK